MAEEFKVLIGAELKSGELDAIKSQINNLQTNPIKLKIDTQNVQSQIDGIKKQIQSLSNIKITLNGGSGGNTGGIQRTVAEVNRAYSDLMNLQKRISSIRIQMGGLDGTKNTRQITELSSQLNRLMSDYNNLYQTFNRSFSTNQLDNLNRAFETTNNKITALDAKMADTSAIKSQESAYKELLAVSKQISNIELKIGGLKSVGGHTNEIAELESQLQLLQSTYQNLATSFQGQLSPTQLTNLGNIIYDTRDKLAQLDAKVADTKAKLASDIQLKVNTGTFDKQLTTLETNFNKLSTSGKSVITDMDAVTQALSNMKSAVATGDMQGLITSYQQYQTALKSTTNQVDIMIQKERELANSEKLASAKTALSSQMDVWLKENSAAASQFGMQIEQLKVRLQSCDATSFGGIKAEFQEITRQAELAGKATQTFGDRLKNQLSKLGTYFSATMMITQAVRGLRSMYDNVVDVDTALTGLYRVTDLSANEYSNLYDQMISSAKEYGATLSDIITSTADWVRLGFDAGDAERLSEITAMYQHVTDLDNSTAVENLVTAYKGYQDQLMNMFDGDSTKAIEYVADIFDKLGNEYAVSAADVGSALTKCASAMEVAGNSIQETSAMATGITEVTQNADKAGSALKILSMRLRGTEAKDLEELGEDTEGLISNTGKLRDTIQDLTNVDIMADDGDFKSTYEMMDGIYETWKTMRDTDKASLLETIAGKNRASEIAALLNNWEQVRSAMQAATDAEGTASAENEKYMQSLQGHLDTLTATWQALSNSFLSSDFLSGALEGLTSFLSGLDAVINKVGVLPTLIGGITAALSVKNVGIFKTIEDEASASGLHITNIFSQAFAALKTNSTFSFGTEFNAQLQNDIACINNFKAAVVSGTPPVEALKNCLLTASQSAVEYATSMEASSLSTDEFATKQKMAAVTAKAQSKSLVTAKALINDYNNQCRNSGLAQTDFLKAVGQSNSGLAKYLSGLNGAKGSLAGYITSLVGAKAASIALQAATMALNVAITMGISMAISGLISMISKWVNAEKEARDAALETGNAAKDSASNIIELYNAYSSANAAYESNTGSKESLEAATDSLLSALGIEESQIQKLKEEYGGLDEAINQVTMDSLKDKLSELTSGYEAAIDELKDKTKDGILKDFGTINFSKQNGAYKEDAYVKALEKAGFKASDNFSYFGGYQGTTIDIGDTSTLEGIMKAYEKLKDMRTALEEGIGDDYSREELAQNDLYKSINGKIGDFEDEYKNVLDYVDKINDVAAQLQYMDIVKTDGVPQSKEQFDALKQSMVDAAKENQNFVGSQDQINDAITNTLSDIPELSQFFNDVGDSAENATKATKEQLESLKSTFQSNDISDWFDSLSDDDKQLIYEISVKSDDTTLWTLSKWKQELSDMSAAGKTSEESLQSFYDVMNNTEDGNFSDKVNDYLDKVQSLKDALTKIDTGELTDTEKVSLALDFPELAGHTGDIDSLRAAITSLIDTSNQGINEEIDSQIKALGGDGTAAASALESLREMLNAIGNTSGWNFDIDAEIEKFNNLYDAMKESVSGTGLSTEGIKNVEAMFSGLKGYDPSVLFERTEHGIHLNTTALRALQSQYESTTKLGIQERLQDLKQEYNDSAKAVEGLTKGTEAYNKALSDKGLRSTDDILADIENVQTLAAQYEGLTSAYNKWVMAQSAGEEGDMYDNITGSLEDIKKLYDDGLVGTNAFRSAVQMMTNEDLSTANIDKLISVYESGYPTMQRYFQDSSDGCINFLKDVESLNSEWAHMNSDGSWDINFGIGNDEEIAKAISDMTGLQMSTEEVQILMRKLSDYGFDIKLDSAYTSVDELKSKIEETEGKLKELGQEPVDIDVNATDAEAELEKAKGKIQEINDSDASVEVKTAQLDDAYAKIDVLVAKVNQPAFMTIDASQVDSELQGSLGTLQEYQNAVNNLNALQIKGADTSEIEAAKGKVDELAGKIKDLPAETKTKIGLEADDSVEDIKSKISSGDVKIPVSADTSQAETEISSIDGQDVKVNVTTSGNEAIDNLKSAIDGIKDKNVTITATAVGKDSVEGLKTATTNLTNKNVTATATPVGKDGVDALKKSIDSLYNRTVTSTAKVVGTNLVVALKTAIDNLYNKTVSVGANVFGTAAVRSLKSAIDSLYNKTVTATTVTKKVAGVDGTAHVNGTAFAQGDWGTKENGVALGGELGQELVVRNGKFFTIGDKSAEFFKYQKGDIIFNAAQTKEIFEKGKITHGTGRGKALAEGTAFSSGSGRFTSGGKTKHTTSGGGGGGSSKSGGGSSGGKSSSSSSSSSKDDSSKDGKETFDWVKRELDKFSKAVERISNQITDYISSALKTSLLKKQMSAIDKEIKANQQGYTAYMEKANSIGISQDYKNKVINGTLKIEDIDTSTDSGKQLAEDVKNFETYYDSAQDCNDKVQELNNTLMELYETLANMPIEKASKDIDKLKNKYDSLNNASDTVSSGGSALNALRNTVRSDIPTLQNANKKVTTAQTKRNNTKKVRSSTNKVLTVAKEDTKKTGNALISAAKKETSTSAKNLKRATKTNTDKATYNAISKAIREGKTVDIKGLKGSTLKYAKFYNKSVKQTNDITKNVNSGKRVSTKNLSKNLQTKSKAYNTDVSEQSSAQKKYDAAKKADDKALKNLNIAKANKDKIYSETTREQQMLATSSTNTTYKIQNKLLDEELKNLKIQKNKYNTAKKQVDANVANARKDYSSAVSSRNKSGNAILNSKEYSKVLSETQKEAIKVGKTVSTKGITNPTLLKKLQEYNEKVKNARTLNQKLNIQLNAQSEAQKNLTDAENEYAQMLVENEQKKLENISNYYDARMPQYENRNSLLNTYMDRMQTRGYNLSANFYTAQIANYQKIAEQQKAELAAMQKQFQESLNNGTIVKGTEEYYQMKDSIDQVAMSISETTNNIVEMQAAIRDLEWEQFDQLQESISRITSESDFLINLMSHRKLQNDDGSLTDQGLATLGLHGVNYNTYMAQADKYKEEMLKISKELANDPNNQKLIDRKNELIDAQQQAILSAENEKDAMKDLIKDGIDKQLDSMKDLIDKYTEALNSQKDLYDYQKKIREKTDEIASLQKQLSSLQGDTSEENKAKLQELKESLKTAQSDLEETQYEKYISDQKELLDNLYDEYETILNQRLDNVDALLSDLITEVNNNASTISDTLTTETQNVGYTLSGEMQTIWSATNGVSSVISEYTNGVFTTATTTVTTAIGNIYERQRDMISAINNMADKYVAKVDELLKEPTQTEGVLEEVEQKPDKDNVAEGNPTPEPPKVSDDESIRDAVLVEPDEPKKKPNKDKTGNDKAEVGDKVTFSSGRYYEASDGTGASGNMYLGKKVKITRINKGSKYPYAIDATDGTELGWVKLSQLKGYASGSKGINNNQYGWTQEQGEEVIIRKSDGAILTPLNRGDTVFNSDMTKNLWDMMKNPSDFIRDNLNNTRYTQVPISSNSNSVDNHFDNITFNLPNVKNTDDFIREIVSDKKFERFLQSVTTDRISGKSSMEKYKFR